MPDMGTMIYDTKTALILRRDLAAWQVANVAAFLAGGLTGTHGHMMGEPYRDGGGRPYTALIREPVYYGRLPDLATTGIAAGAAALSLGLGFAVFQRLSPRHIHYL